MHPEIKKGYIAFAAIVIVAAVVIGYFAFAGQAPVQTATDTGGGSQGGNGNPAGIVTGTATPTPGQTATGAETGTYVPLNLNGIKDIPLDNLPEKIFLTTQIYLRDFKKQGPYLYYFIGSTSDIKSQSQQISFMYRDKDGKIIGTVAYGLTFGYKDQITGQYEFYPVGSVGFAKGIENYARIPMPMPEAKFLGMSVGS